MGISLSGQVAIVTGAGRGIGAATARSLAALGVKVACLARSQDEIDAVAAAIQEQGGQALAVPCDVSDRDSVNAAVKVVTESFGAVHIVVNNAGYCHPQTLVEMSPEVFRATMDVNVSAIFHMCQAVLPAMIEAQSGQIVNVASISGVRGSSKFPGFTAYAAAKAGAIVLTEALAAELREHKIRVNAISPGSVDTKMLRDVAPGVEPAMMPEDIAASIVFLLTTQPINGSNLEVFG